MRVLLGLQGALVLLALSGCDGGTSADPPDPGITCRDGYVAHPSYSQDQDGCGPHAGAVDEFMDRVQAYLDQLPNTPIAAYVCHDGWRSSAVGDQGACSSHGGVWKSVFPDGTEVVEDGPGLGTIFKPDGTTVQPYGTETGH